MLSYIFLLGGISTIFTIIFNSFVLILNYIGINNYIYNDKNMYYKIKNKILLSSLNFDGEKQGLIIGYYFTGYIHSNIQYNGKIDIKMNLLCNESLISSLNETSIISKCN